MFKDLTPAVTTLMSSFVAPVTRPDAWVSTSYPADAQPVTMAADFFSDNLVNPVYFEQNVRENLPGDAIVVGT